MPDNHFNFQVRFSPAMTKEHWGVRDHFLDPAQPAENEITIHSARNEVTGVQLRLAGSQDFTLALDRTNWLHPKGFLPRLRLEVDFASLPAGSVEVMAVGYVEGDDRRQWMEYLDRCGYAEVPQHRPQAVYIRIRVPADLTTGSHAGRLRLFSQFGFEDEAPAWEGTVHLKVASAVLPLVKDWSFHLNLWQHCTSIARFHHAPLWSETHFALIDRYYASLAQLGQKAVSIIAAEIPWSGQRCFRDTNYPSYLFEHASVDVSRDSTGQLLFNFSKMDRLLELAARHGIDREIDLFGLINVWVDIPFGFGKVALDAPDSIRVRCFDQSTGSFTYLKTAKELSVFIRALQDHMAEKDVLTRVRLQADEPADMEKFNSGLEFIRQAAPGFRFAVSIDHIEFMEVAAPEILDFIPVLPHICHDPQLTARLADRARSRGGRTLFYICCWPPIPNTFIHSPLVEGELLGWLAYYLKLDGMERWAFCLWPAEPWQRVSWRAPEWFAGDMYYVLPGKDGAPVETLRYEAVRSAAQDYELLKLVERSLSPQQASAVIEKAFSRILHTTSIQDFENVNGVNPESLYSLDPADYQEARRILLDALEG